jgi:hypothetical protein
VTWGCNAAIVPWRKALTAERRYVATVELGAAVNHFVNGAAITTWRTHAQACTERTPAVPAFGYAQQGWLAC